MSLFGITKIGEEEREDEKKRAVAQKPPFFTVAGEIIAIWAVANGGSYIIPQFFGFSVSYNTSPGPLAMYFGFWVLFTLYYFWNIYRQWLRYDLGIWVYVLLSVEISAAIGGLIYALSFLPILHGPLVSPYSDLLFATPWYFLPKSMEILLQQLLVVALVLELKARFETYKKVLIGYLICFGGAHVILFFYIGVPLYYATIMTSGSILSAFIFPRLILNVRGGFVYSYIIHFMFYVLLVAFLHVLLLPGDAL